jgi:ribosome biogenesis GTPase / thiamine phosphate phosphatase
VTSGDAVLVGRVLRAQSGFYRVALGERDVTCVLRGRVKRERRETGLVALGDLVRLELLTRPEGDAGHVEAVIAEILPRSTVLARRAPGPRGVWMQDVVVANIDQMVPVFAVQHPPPQMRMLDRFLAVAEIDGIDSVIVFNKVDFGVSAEVLAAAQGYRDIGYRVLFTSAVAGEGVADLEAVLADRTSAVVGPSGVGKSALLNAIAPHLDLREGAVSQAVAKGQHTTRVGELHRLPGGGLVADTPGLREVGVWRVDPGLLEFAFVEFRPFVHTCRFYDCTHVHEPDCAVRAAVVRGDVSPERYASYVRLTEDAE